MEEGVGRVQAGADVSRCGREFGIKAWNDTQMRKARTSLHVYKYFVDSLGREAGILEFVLGEMHK